MDQWQPIETAPKDRRILLYQSGGGGEYYTPAWQKIFTGFWWDDWYENEHFWTADEDRGFEVNPTHWMPLPAPPK